MSQSVAPDVDIKSRGFLVHVLTAGVVVAGIAIFFISQHNSVDGEDSNDSDIVSPLWPVWLLLWLVMRFAQGVSVLFAILLGFLVWKQRTIIYVPTPPGATRSPKENIPALRTPQRWDMPFESIMIRTEDGTRIHAWFLYQPNTDATDLPYTFLYFHGNAGNIGHRLENMHDLFVKLKINILAVEYRGYGDSEDGSGPSEHGFLQDAVAAHNWLLLRSMRDDELGKVDATRIVIFGRSIGGAVGMRLLDNLTCKTENGMTQSDSQQIPAPVGLIIENSFISLKDMAVEVFPFLWYVQPFLRWPLLLDEWRAAESLRRAAARRTNWGCCLLSGLRDEIVPPSQMRSLNGILDAHSPAVHSFNTFEFGSHNDTPSKGGVPYWACLQLFMKDLRTLHTNGSTSVPAPRS